MNPGIFLLQKNGELVEMNEETYDSEDLLQTFLANIQPSSRETKWILIVQEMVID
jgi:hypothetical protein